MAPQNTTRKPHEIMRKVKWHQSVPGDPYLKYTLLKFGTADFLNGQLSVTSACASFVLKGEDKHALCYDECELEDCQVDHDSNVPVLLAFAGVFDGHGGHLASAYCAAGMLPHILAETADCIHKHPVSTEPVKAMDGTMADSPLEAGFINAYHSADARFVARNDPPTFADVKRGVAATRARPPRRLLGRLRAKKQPNIKGGTTAATLSIFAEKDKAGKPFRVMPYAVVANAGDSRILTDDATGTSSFRQVTVDHRPATPSESIRLLACERRKECVVKEDPTEEPYPILRVFPGGLAVSRTVGDVDLSSAAICTPDIFRVQLPLSSGGDGPKTQRFILASDGLFDVMSNEEIGKLAARVQTRPDSSGEVIVSTRDATVAVMEHALEFASHFDDIHILVVDVTYNGKKLAN